MSYSESNRCGSPTRAAKRVSGMPAELDEVEGAQLHGRRLHKL